MRFPLRLVLLIALLLISCAKKDSVISPHGNYPPEITSMDWNPKPVHAWQLISVQCSAKDRNGDRLAFSWGASAGGFPSGNQQIAVSWRSPASFEPDTLRVYASDGKAGVTRDTVITITRVAPPPGMRFTNGPNLIDVQWDATPDEGLDGFSGYEVFSAPRSMIGIPSDSLVLLGYRIGSGPVSRYEYRISAQAGERRYYAVCCRRDYQGVKERSMIGPEVDTATGLYGFGSTLYEVASTTDDAGVQLRTGRLFPLDVAGRDSIDLYLGTSDPRDVPIRYHSPLLKSPSLLAYRDPAWAERVTEFQRLGDDWDVAYPIAGAPWVTSDSAVVGGVYAVHTADGHYGKFRVLEMRASPPERRIEFQWAWQPLRDYPRF